MFEIIGCPMHLGVSEDGLKKSISSLNERFNDIKIKEICEVILPEENLKNLKNLNSVVATCNNIANEVIEVLQNGNRPLFIGGDHSASMGTISGVSTYYKGNDIPKSLGVIWVDSHSDINTDVTTITGNIHGMPVSALMGFGNEKLVSIKTSLPKVLPQHFVLFGVRDMDLLEKDIVEKLDIKIFTHKEIVERSLAVCLEEAKEYLASVDIIHVSVDLDSINPEIITGVTVPVKGGFSPKDVLDIADYFLANTAVSSMDIVEYNPKFDKDFFTANYVNALIKKIIKEN